MRNAEGFLCVFLCTDSAGDTNRASVFVPDGWEYAASRGGELR